VSYVVDHHVDSGAYQEMLKEKECRFIGSACSLVALMVQRDLHIFEADLAKSDEPNFAYLLAAAVVLDSYNFLEEIRGKKWNEDDVAAHKFLMEYADVGFQYWKELNDIKFDTAAALELGLRAMFTRDYKKYDLKKGIMGVAVVTAQVAEIIDRFGHGELITQSVRVLDEDKLGIFVIIGIHATQDGHVDKSLLVFIDKEKQNDLTSTFEELNTHIQGVDEMKLHTAAHEEHGKHRWMSYKIGNTAYTRKAFEAIVKKYYLS